MSIGSLIRTWATIVLLIAAMLGLLWVVRALEGVLLPEIVRFWGSVAIAAAETILLISTVKAPEWARR